MSLLNALGRHRGVPRRLRSSVRNHQVQTKAVLVIEEEFLIATDIEQTLLSAGIPEVTVFQSVTDFRASGLSLQHFDVAFIEAMMGHQDVVQFVRELHSAGVAVVVTSADRGIQRLFEGATSIEKPFDGATLVTAYEQARLAGAALR